MSLWFSLLYQPLVNVLIFAYQLVGQNLGIAIILVTIVIRLVLLPLTAPSMKSAQKMQELKPELDKLKEKYKEDKQALAQAQLDLYKKHGVNPAAGILPMIVQIVVLIALFQAFNNVLKPSTEGVGELNKVLYSVIQLPEKTQFNTRFLYLDITQPDVFKLPQELNFGFIKLSSLPGPLLLFTAAAQWFSSTLTTFTKKKQPKKKKKTNDQEDMAQAMQKQMRFLMPLMTMIIGLRFASGLVLYWLTFSLILVIQQFLLKENRLGFLKKINKSI